TEITDGGLQLQRRSGERKSGKYSQKKKQDFHSPSPDSGKGDRLLIFAANECLHLDSFLFRYYFGGFPALEALIRGWSGGPKFIAPNLS
ncbi:hypothetical protein V2J09_015978, partial [Rumex salicifolius]